MNYYEHHIGDYAEATAHLSFVEDAAYSRLIRKYYAQEKPLPADLKSVQRLIGARSKEEKEAVALVLEEFFTLQDDGWHNARCDEELEKYHAKAEGRDEKREAERERQRRHRQRRKELFEALRSHGITPVFDTTTDELVTMLSRVTNTDELRDVTRPVTRDATATQAPSTSHQSPDIEANTASDDSTGMSAGNAGAARCTSGEISKAMRSNGIQSQPHDPRIMALAEQGVAVDTVVAACKEARESRPNEAIGPAYVIRIIERWSRDAAAIKAQGATQPRKTTTTQDSRAAAAASIGLGGPSNDDDNRTIDGQTRFVD